MINEFEVKVTEYRRATSDLMGIKYAKGAFFGMFNKNKCGNNAGIVAQQKWAKNLLYSVIFTSNSFINSILDSSISANSRTLI
jgi:hypothetical protein